MRSRFGIALQLLLLAAALPAAAYRREYLVMLDDARKAGSEVCFYRGDTGSALTLFFTPGKVGCLPADRVLDLPPGTFSFFARHKDDYVSVLRDYTIYDGPPMPERGYQKIEIPLLPAGTVDAAVPARSLDANQSLGIWVAPTPTSPGSFIRLVTGETTIVAPANTRLLPLLLEGGVPVAAGDVISVDEGAHVALPAFTRDRTTSDVIVWLNLDRKSFQQARGILPPPEVTLAAKGKNVKPLFSLFEPSSKTLLVFRDVPAGPATLRLTGAMWTPVKRAINVSGDVVVEREGLPMVAGGSVRVQWKQDGDETAHTPSCTGASTADAPRVAAAVLKCNSDAGCTEVAASSAPFQGNSSLSVDGVPAGSYVVAVRPPFSREQRFPVQIVTAQQETVSIAIAPFSFFGTVKLNGQPVHAHLVFATGEVMTDDTGRYTASLAGPPLTNIVRVELCGSSRWYDHFPSSPVDPNIAHDIDLRVTPLTIHITDPASRPLKDADVSLCVVKKLTEDATTPQTCRHSYFAGHTNGEGELVAEIPVDLPIQACAVHAGFARKCGAVVLPKLEERRTLVQFDAVGLRGRVEGHSGAGTLTFVAQTGQTTEEVPLAPDGTFIARLRHAPPEHFVYASANRPLTVLPMPIAASEDLVVTIPRVPVRSFTVTAPDMTAKVGFVGVWIGGLYVPLLALDFHQTARGLDSMLFRGTTLELRDISETGPITVALGVPSEPAAPQFVDIFALPQFAGVRQHAVKGTPVTLGKD